jgi:lipoyl(octanoyl) transferase
MSFDSAHNGVASPALEAYLLGSVEFEDALALQRQLVFQVRGTPSTSALLLCEHPAIITIGRSGSRRQVLCEPDELAARQWRVRWINRGGGCLLHVPGQLAIYPILALDHHKLGVQDFLDRLHQVVLGLLEDFGITGERRPGQAGVWVRDRPIAVVGVAVRGWVTYYGAFLNVNPDLAVFRRIHLGQRDGGFMTSLERERRGPLRSSLVRERLLERFCAHFEFPRTSVFHEHPGLRQKAASDAVTTRR